MRRIALILLAGIFVVCASAEIETLPEIAPSWPEPFQRTFIHVATWQWLGILAILAICAIAYLVIRSVSRRVTHLRDRMAPQPMTDATRVFVSRAAGLLGGGALARSLLEEIDLPVKFEHKCAMLALGVVLLSGIMLLYGWWDITCDSITARAAGHDRAERLLVPMMRKFVRAIIVIIGILACISLYFGAQTLTGLVAGLGVTGVVVALAGKDSVENVFGSLTILFDMPFALTDWVKIDKVEGSVEEINLRSTRIRTAADTLITLPNANLIRASVENFGSRRLRRQKMSIRVSYSTTPEAITGFCDDLRSYLGAIEEVESSKTIVQLDDPQENSVGVHVEWFLNTTSAMEEAVSRNNLLAEALRLKKQHGVLFLPPGMEPAAAETDEAAKTDSKPAEG